MFKLKEIFSGEQAKKNQSEQPKDPKVTDKDPYVDQDDKYKEHNPFDYPLSGEPIEGHDVLDKENSYNIAGFENYKLQYEVPDESEPKATMAELLEKYDFEELDLKMYGEKCRLHEQGLLKTPPFADPNKNHELATWYEDKLRAENTHGLPYSEEELQRLTPEEQVELVTLYKERQELHNQLLELYREREGELDSEQRFAYSTATKGADTRYPAYNRTQAKHILKALSDNDSRLAVLENKLLTDPKVLQARQARQKIAEAKREAKRAEQELEKTIPDYSDEDIALQNACLDYLTIQNDKSKRLPRPKFVDGSPMTGEQILEVAQEAAQAEIADKEMMVGNFFVEDYRGTRQLAHKEGPIKFVFPNSILPSGKYAFKVDIDSMLELFAKVPPKKNFVLIPINLMVNLANPKEVMAKINENKNKLEQAKKTDKSA